ncbi:uncharacterized protein [Apostichopus japonicus]|uniref:uncharacterized protein isoform X2 n=1 Tax=Stichopus japonicus TaxID=307972 RepID=UPI003AB79DBA
MPQYGEQNADLLNLLPQHEMLKGTIHQSRPLPPWLWYIIAKLVGVKTKPSEWPIFGYLLLILTVSSGLIYLISTGVFYYFDVNNSKTSFDALSYFITVIMAFGFFFIGLYGNKLAHKLFSNRVFVQSLRLHSRTVLKISAPILLCAVGLGFLVLFEISNKTIYRDNYCEKINLPPMLCHFRYVSQIIFAFLAFLWNFLIALICFSACRTHTIAIRTFLLELDEDAMVNLLKESKVSTRPIRPKSHSFSESLLPSETSPSETSPLLAGVGNRRSGVLRTRSQSELRSVVRDVLDDEWENAEYQRRASSVSRLHPQQIFQFPPRFTIQDAYQTDDAFDRGTVATDWPNLSTATGLTSYSHAPSNRMLTNKEILQRYWKLQCRLMTTSLALQRWMTCWGTPYHNLHKPYLPHFMLYICSYPTNVV